jgi:allantoicase
MSDGWETKRRRGPGHDWVIIKLARRGQIRRVEVDTAHFKGNFPESCSLEACHDLSAPWSTVLPRTKLQAHTRHFFDHELLDTGVASHLRFSIFPDGGVSRLRVYGTLVD